MRPGGWFTVTGKVVKRGTASGVAGMPVVLQRRQVTQTTWSDAVTGTTGAGGTKAWAVRQYAGTYYRVLARGVTTWFGSLSNTRGVTMR